jgi:hypothetical protein
MIATGYVTNDINYGGLYPEIRGITVSPSTQSFSYGDVISYTCSYGGGGDWSFKGWFVVDASNVFRRENRLPIDCNGGAQWTATMNLIMNYNNDVSVIAELT